jgi:2-polyprenyl-6-methoxyphenol hydroxylase-like FAD-dependent oxidoreductase
MTRTLCSPGQWSTCGHDWYSGRVDLCGDAATAFLPTAGVGAPNAMRSAAALADKLRKSDAARVPLTLDLYVKRCQKAVCHNRDGSRAVARHMFTESNALTKLGRDQLVKHHPASRALKQIIRSMRQPESGESWTVRVAGPGRPSHSTVIIRLCESACFSP